MRSTYNGRNGITMPKPSKSMKTVRNRIRRDAPRGAAAVVVAVLVTASMLDINSVANKSYAMGIVKRAQSREPHPSDASTILELV
jgi:hypothetical protein